MHTLTLPAPSPSLGDTFDAVAMSSYPWLARLAGYTFEVGNSERLRLAARSVLHGVWAARGVTPPADPSGFGQRYDDATTWIVAFCGETPVGVMGLLDVRRACLCMDLLECRFPAGLDRATTREIGRLAILPPHRGRAPFRGGPHRARAPWVMIGLLREMLAWSRANGVVTLLAASERAMFPIYQRYNPTARLLDAPARVEPESAESRAWFAGLRTIAAGNSVMCTFEVAGASPWNVFTRFLTGRLRTVSR